MRVTEVFDKNWLFHEETEPARRPENKGYGYCSAKTERLKFGPGAYQHFDEPDSWNLFGEIIPEKWEAVDLPHDYVIGQTPDENKNPAFGFFNYNNGWYRKHFTVSEEHKGQRITILFEGVTGNATVYLNGCLLKYNHCGFTPFEVDISDYVFYDKENVMAVYVDVSLPETWWYYGGGIYRHVYITYTDVVSVDLYGVFVHPEKIDENQWKVPVTTTVRNDSYGDEKVTVCHKIVDAKGKVWAKFSEDCHLPMRRCVDVNAETAVSNPLLWDVDFPNLYYLETEIVRNGEVCDKVQTRFGFRTIHFDAEKGFFLNGRSVKIKGVCSHQDFGLTGKAVPDNIYRYRIAMLKEMGANGYRTSHYPHDPATMDALDEMGFLVAAETRHYDSSPDALAQAEITVKRDRNRPSVICWLTGNEELYYHNVEQGINIHKAMSARIKQTDNTRLVSSAVGFPEKAIVHEATDFLGINYRFKEFDNIRAKYPGKAVLSTENCACTTSLGTYFGDVPSLGRIDSRDKDRNTENMYFGREGTWKYFMSKEWICGGYQWAAFEHRGEATWPRLCSASGAIDLFLRKKDAFYQNKSHWTTEPMVHIMQHWNHEGMEGISINVWAYTNCTELELILNGKSFGRISIEKYGHGEWDVPYESGELTVVGYIDGKEVIRQSRVTSGQAKVLHLEMETPVAESCGNNIALIKCYCTDEEGRYVPDAAPYVTFETDTTKGNVIGTGSSSSDHNPVTSVSRQMFLGEIRVGVKPTENAEEVWLYAFAPGLKKAVIKIPFVNANKVTDLKIKSSETGGHIAN